MLPTTQRRHNTSVNQILHYLSRFYSQISQKSPNVPAVTRDSHRRRHTFSFAISANSISIEQYQPTKRYRVNILAAFTPVSHLKIGFYTEGYAPFLCRSHSVLSDHRRGVHPSEQRARCVKRSLYTEGFGPPSYAPHSVLSGTEGGRPPFRALALVVPNGVYTLKGLDPLPMPKP